MTHATRAELAEVTRVHYAAAQGKDKRQILEEFIAPIGYHEKSGIRVLNSAGPKRRKTRTRPSLYDGAVRAALIVFLKAPDRVCGKHLKALLPHLLAQLLHVRTRLDALLLQQAAAAGARRQQLGAMCTIKGH